MKKNAILSRMQVTEPESVFHQNEWMITFLTKCEIIDFSAAFQVPTCQAFNQDLEPEILLLLVMNGPREKTNIA